MRSKLFVPAARPELFDKALKSDADALSFDLEDAVPEEGKAAARSMLAEALRSDAMRASTKTLIVRVNAHGTEHFQRDLAVLAAAPLDLINLPKIEDPGQARAAAEAIAIAAPGVRLLVNIETARALSRAAEIARAHASMVGLQVGLNDLFAPLQIERGNQAHVHAALWQIRMAAAEADMYAYDGAWADLRDAAGLHHEAELAASLGYRGKTCIHPSQIAAVNEIFARADELTLARRILDAARVAAADGKGAFVLDGKMIDKPAITHAASLVAAAETRDA